MEIKFLRIKVLPVLILFVLFKYTSFLTDIICEHKRIVNSGTDFIEVIIYRNIILKYF